jgi:hypothetical protein
VLQLAVFAGHSSCIDFDGVEVVRARRERSREVHAFVTYNGDDVCTDNWGAGDGRAVRAARGPAAARLRKRRVDGHGWNRESDVDCAEVRDEHL